MKRIAAKILLTLFLGSIVTLAFNVQLVRSDYSWSETIYIGADGSITPSAAPISTADNLTYTFTDNILDAAPSLYDNAIVIERDHVVLDGAGYTLQGVTDATGTTGLWSVGIQLTEKSNVTIKSLTITQFYYGIRLHSSSGNTILGNNLTDNYESGVDLAGSHNNTISANVMTGGSHNGVYLEESHNNTIAGNTVTDNTVGIYLYQSSNNTVTRNEVTDGNTLVYVRATCSNNTVSFNNITYANYNGVYLHGSSNTTMYGNNITNNGLGGVHVADSSGNIAYHNNFVDNAAQVYVSVGDGNFWNIGYPSGGNYWSDYNGTDSFHGPGQNMTGSDGIGDTAHVLDTQNNDSYPLMGPINFFDVGTWDGKTYSVQTVSNSTVSNVNFSITLMMVSFNVTGLEGTIGFSRAGIPKDLLYSPDPMNWEVRVNSTEVPFRVLEENDGDCTYIYLSYEHDTKEVQIIGTEVIPEFPSLLILSLFVIVALLAVTFCRRESQNEELKKV